MQQTTQHSRHFIVYTLAGLCNLFIAIGLARFAYTPLLPLMIHQHWVSTAQAGYLGAINFLGYLLGAIITQTVRRHLGLSKTIHISLILCTLSLLCCAAHLGLTWLYSWRFISGLSGAFLVILTPSLIYPYVPQHKKASMAGLMFAGVGLAIIISGLIIPHIPSVMAIWLSLGGLAVCANLLAAWLLPSAKPISQQHTSHALSINVSILLLMLAYLLFSIGFTPHNLFIVAYMSEFLHESTMVTGFCWSVYGIGTAIGSLLIGVIADRCGMGKTYLAGFLLACLALLAILYHPHIITLYSTSFIMGCLAVGMVSLSSALLTQLTSAAHYAKLWSIMTILFALGQTAFAYLISYMIDHNHQHYQTMLWLALITLIISALSTLKLINIERQ